MPRHLLLLAALAALAAPAIAGDAEPSGLDLLERCHTLELMDQGGQEPDARMMRDYGYCLGFLVGFVSGFAARDAAGEAGRFCPPADARIRDFADALRGWLVQNPDELEQMGALVMLQALQWRYPCTGKAGAQ
jgi:hypothetical protein